MKIVHCESGLGNQMLNYAEYLAIKLANPRDKVVMERLIYETKPDDEGINQWNGYELEKVFGIRVEDLSSVICDIDYQKVKKALIESEYWKNNWKYATPIVDTLNILGYDIQNLCRRGTEGDQEKHSQFINVAKKICMNTLWGNTIYRKILPAIEGRLIRNVYEDLFVKSQNNFYVGQTLKFMYKGMGIEKIEKELRNDFQFLNINEKNKKFADVLSSLQSVSIHVRRGDFISRNLYCYKYGYFSRAVKLIKNKLEDPTFFFFCDKESADWIKNNLEIFDINNMDKVEIVNWNKYMDSYQDLYLMSKCKHNITTQSSFGWWGSWLNDNKNKITISPDPRMNTIYWV